MACLISIAFLTFAAVRVGFGAPTGPVAGAASERPGTAGAGSQNGATPRPGSPRSFVNDAGPVFRRHCVRCHNEDDNGGGLRLDTYEGALRGGDRGPAVIPHNPAASLILQKVLHRDRPYMPPKKFLPVVEIDILRTWIEDGARR
jgi:mono/diheme cytochrome c family protein